MKISLTEWLNWEEKFTKKSPICIFFPPLGTLTIQKTFEK